MLLEAARKQLFAFNAKKGAQWERVIDAGHVTPVEGTHLHLAREGEGQSKWMMTWSSEPFYEGVMFGQLPESFPIATGAVRLVKGERQTEFREATEAEKPLYYRSLDLTNDEIDAVLALWKQNCSAIELRFVDCVLKNDGIWHGKDGGAVNTMQYAPPV